MITRGKLGNALVLSLAAAMFLVSVAPAASEQLSEPLAEGVELVEPAGPSTLLDTSCSNGYVCMWTNSDFRGTKRIAGAEACCDWISIFDIRSAKNRFADRGVAFRTTDRETTRCLNPGENNAQFVPTMADFRITQRGGRC